jgi:hypothetical protein
MSFIASLTLLLGRKGMAAQQSDAAQIVELRYPTRSQGQRQRFADPEERERHGEAIRMALSRRTKKARARHRARVSKSWTVKTVRAKRVAGMRAAKRKVRKS